MGDGSGGSDWTVAGGSGLGMTISRKTLHDAREHLQVIMGNLELAMQTCSKFEVEYLERAKVAVRKLAQTLGDEKLAKP